MKSYVSLEQQICIVCGKPQDMGILLDRRLKNSLERTTVTGFTEKPCKDCEANMEDRVALVAIDPEKSTLLPNGNADPTKAYRTGEVAFLRKSVWAQVFNVPIPPKDVAFVEPQVIQMLASQTKE